MRTLLTAAPVALLATVLVAGCGETARPTGASDPTPTASTPTAEPTVGSYPSYEPEDYSYTLRVSCFCPDAGDPVRVSVEDGAVVKAVLVGHGRHGVLAPDYRWLTINDVIEAANSTAAAKVLVTWPAGQDYPSRVYVDQDTRMVDEEIGYEISDVTPG